MLEMVVVENRKDMGNNSVWLGQKEENVEEKGSIGRSNHDQSSLIDCIAKVVWIYIQEIHQKKCMTAITNGVEKRISIVLGKCSRCGGL